MKVFRSLPIAFVILMNACQGAHPSDSGPGGSFLRATLSGAVQTQYEGTGTFFNGGGPGSGSPPSFGLNSSGGASSRDQAFSLTRNQSGHLPERGTYPLQLPKPAAEQWPGFAAVYRRMVHDGVESYVSDAGEVTITSSSPHRVEGTFRFSGVRYCARTLRGLEGACGPGEIDPNAPRIEVAGSFSAVPDTDEWIPLRGW
jgi:hypothetical protein